MYLVLTAKVFIIFIGLCSTSLALSFYRDITNLTNDHRLNRITRQATSCRKQQTACDSGECISKFSVCDGTKDCQDGSDETFKRCSKMNCPSVSFKCAYGGCVAGNAKCDGVNDCADGSDEDLQECNNGDPAEVKNPCGAKQFTCDDGQCISVYEVCDGIPNCEDKSDETRKQCGSLVCGDRFFQCAYGACVDGNAPCNGIQECADNSDETGPLCKDSTPGGGTGTPTQQGCILPSRPKNGKYKVNGKVNFRPGTSVKPFTRLDFECDPGFKMTSIADVSCSDNNKWNRPIPECLRTCPAISQVNIEIICKLNGITVDCTEPALPNTTASFKCREKYYYLKPGNRDIPPPWNSMKCTNGNWNQVISLIPCTPECGIKYVKSGTPFVISNSTVEKVGEFPWHVGLYQKKQIGGGIVYYSNICGGSIVNSRVVITAAHCFDPAGRDPNDYAVAAGKVYKKWMDEKDKNAQYRGVAEIHIPQKYGGDTFSFAHDIAVLVVDRSFEFNEAVLPICVDWSKNSVNLQKGQFGTIAGWGLTSEGGEQSPVLKFVDLPYIPFDDCLKSSDADFQRYVGVEDKICAGRDDGQNVCEGDSGGGYAVEQKDKLYYLMALVSIGKKKAQSCDASKYVAFTSLNFHVDWVNKINQEKNILKK